MEHYKFYQNRACEFFPCHQGVDEESFNCLFCYCPLYALADRCGGLYVFMENGMKDCSNCIRPHVRENYDLILSELRNIIELGKKKTNNGKTT